MKYHNTKWVHKYKDLAYTVTLEPDGYYDIKTFPYLPINPISRVKERELESYIDYYNITPLGVSYKNKDKKL